MDTDIYTLSVALPKAQPQVGMCVLGIYFRYPGSEPPRGGAQLLPGFCQRQATGALVLTPSPCLVLTLGSGWALGAHLLTNFTALCLPRGVSRFWIRTEEPDRYLLRPRVVTALMCANEQISHALWQTDLHHPLDLVFYPFKIYFLLEHNSLKFTRVCNSVFKKKKKNTFTVYCNHHHYQISGVFHHPQKEKSVPIKHSFSKPLPHSHHC